MHPSNGRDGDVVAPLPVQADRKYYVSFSVVGVVGGGAVYAGHLSGKKGSQVLIMTGVVAQS